MENGDQAQIKFPSPQKMEDFATMIQLREPSVSDVVGFIGGVSIPIASSETARDQSENYNGYHHDTMCNNVFMFTPDGKIAFGCINFPDSWHDSQVAAPLIAAVSVAIGIYKLCVDQGFPRSGDLFDTAAL